MRLYFLFTIFLFAIFTANTACSQSNKERQYTIIVELERDVTYVTGKIETDTISENNTLFFKNDKEAYLSAYESTCFAFVQYTYMYQKQRRRKNPLFENFNFG